MPRRLSIGYTAIANAAAPALLLLASRPAAVNGFSVVHHGGLSRIRTDSSPIHSSGGGQAVSSKSTGSTASCCRKFTLLMGASRDDHTDRRDQWEGWDMEDNGEDEVVRRRAYSRACVWV